jgi:arylsulfatase A-like enzyme
MPDADPEALMSTRTAAVAAVSVLVVAVGCGRTDSARALTAEMPVHLEDRIDAASVEGPSSTESALEPVTWRFDAEQPAWKPVTYPDAGTVALSRGEDGLRLDLREANRLPEGEGFVGAIAVELPDWRRDEWGEIVVEARTDGGGLLIPLFNLGRRTAPFDEERSIPYLFAGDETLLLRDGATHTYRLRADWSDPGFGPWQGPWRELGLEVWAFQPASVDILSIEVVPKTAAYAGALAGTSSEMRGDERRRALFVHTPSRVTYPVRVPEQGRLDVGLGVLQPGLPVTFRVTAAPDGGEERVLLEETVDDAEAWMARDVDLSQLAGRAATLTLETRSERQTVAFWTAPTLSGERSTDKPNVIFYVIDGGGADLMSVYGYNRRTTPNLERLAAEGAVFDHARSNAAWTKPSTASFMTSLQQSVLGGFMSLHGHIPARAVTMAERFHAAGYQTAVFTSNPWAGSLSNLERGVDVFRDHGTEDSESSTALQEEFWRWRAEYPGEPYWVHFQTTDVHEPHRPAAPFAGMFVSPERRTRFYEWWRQVNFFAHDFAQAATVIKDPANTLSGLYRARLAAQGADPTEFFDTQRALYDETMAHQDHEIGRLVERLRASGEWDHTLLVVASDHGHPAGSFSRFGRELFDPPPPDTEGALLDSYRTRIPMIFVWPGHIAPGQRFSQDVSMIDMLPTLLDLVGLPMPEVMQGQSLAPLLRGEPGWEPRPVILEQLQPVPDHDAFVGHIEMIDGRWGASLEIWPAALDGDPTVRPVGQQRAARPHRPGEIPELLLYDLRDDPFVRHNVNAQYPELVEKYTALLRKQWEAHQALAGQFEAGGEVELTAEQLETLRALGYVQ